ncbi:uncharacterized protein LOC122565067 [Chiloscyllium plagiosum]|uniref:uncharacterized protein LOC122565067 n=1 Tax=Chiloscyllium plagiosum TaxID=36176 RepID=UPI001CB7B113|nr:uncharacterized protein LOC122565067 [Chiloscyllium plagiosum]
MKLFPQPPTAPHTKVNGYSLIFQPALNQTSFTLVLRNKSMYQTAISLAPYNISIIAFNRAGTSCMESIFIPAAPPEETPFLNVTVINNQTLKASWTHHEAKFYCIVLELVKVRILSNSCQPRRELKIKSKTGMFQKVFEGLQPLRFYRVTVHTNGFRKRKGCQSVGGYTIGSGSACTQQLPPTHGPRKVNVTNIRKHSALLEWKEMPLEQCQGSMQKYLIIYRDHWNHTHTASVNSSTLSFTLLSLNASSLYTVEICAVTTAGIGANTLRNFQTKEYDGNELTVIVVVTAICVMFGVFAIAAVCQYSIKRSKRIIFPKIPDPVNSLVVKSFHNHPSTKLWASSSDDQDVADVLVVMVTVQSDTTTASVNEKDEDELISLGEGEICPSYSSGSNTPFQYRRQMGTTMGMDDDLCSESEFKQNLETEATELINSKFHHLCLPSYTASAPNLCTNISLLAMYDQNVSKEEAEEGNAE